MTNLSNLRRLTFFSNLSSSTSSALKSAQDTSRINYEICSDLHFVDFGWRPTCHLWEDEPSNNNGDQACSREAATQKRRQHFSPPYPPYWKRRCTYKKPVLTPQPFLVKVPLIIRGVVKLNIMPKRLDVARDQAAVLARRRCSAVSAA